MLEVQGTWEVRKFATRGKLRLHQSPATRLAGRPEVIWLCWHPRSSHRVCCSPCRRSENERLPFM